MFECVYVILECLEYGILFPNQCYKVVLVPHLDVLSLIILKPTL